MGVTCLIPTYGDRPESLIRCIKSIGPDITVRVLENKTGWITAVNNAYQDVRGKMLLASDDMKFHEGAIIKANEALDEFYPDGDGVVGFKQANLDESACEAGYILLGEKFLERFSEGLFCPDYKHYFADTELWRFAKWDGSFYFCEDAKVNHYHFSVTGFQDETTRVSRKSYERDRDVAEKRREAGFLWGRDFNLIGEA